jgi:hypothetical protein
MEPDAPARLLRPGISCTVGGESDDIAAPGSLEDGREHDSCCDPIGVDIVEYKCTRRGIDPGEECRE